MKVLWFSNTPALGVEYISKDVKVKGTGGWLYSLNKLLQDKLELHVAFHYPKKMVNFTYQDTYFYPIKFKGNFYFNNIKNIFSQHIIDREYEQEYFKIIEAVNPDIIHIHGTENPFGCIIGKVNIPVVVSIQGNITVYYQKYCAGIEKEYLKISNSKLSIRSLLNGRFPFLRSLKKFEKMKDIETRNLQKCKYIIGRTDWDRRITRVFAPNSEYFYGSEILRDSFYNHKWEPPAKLKFTIFTTNGDNPYKGFETIVQSVGLLNKLGFQFEWRVAGIDSDSHIRRVVKKKLKKAFDERNLVLLGSLDENQLVNELMKSHLYIMPSHIENSPNNLCEAMIVGLPCIATYAGGTGSLLKDKEEGLLIQDGDPWSLSGAILEIQANYSQAIGYGLKARETALKRHNKEKIVNELIETYNMIENIKEPRNH